jgi:D-sedoheptulose 7-phosphate isomerase
VSTPAAPVTGAAQGAAAAGGDAPADAGDAPVAAVVAALRASISVKERLVADPARVARIAAAAAAVTAALRAGHKALFCGNGGSAADAQHLAAELSGRFAYDREPLDAEALHVNTSYLTAVGNDYGYDEVFARAVRGRAKSGDVLVALSTSGTSPNILRALEAAGRLGVVRIGFTGEGGGAMAALVEHLLDVPSRETPRIQEAHIAIGHILCGLVEAALFPRGPGPGARAGTGSDAGTGADAGPGA